MCPFNAQLNNCSPWENERNALNVKHEAINSWRSLTFFHVEGMWHAGICSPNQKCCLFWTQKSFGEDNFLRECVKSMRAVVDPCGDQQLQGPEMFLNTPYQCWDVLSGMRSFWVLLWIFLLRSVRNWSWRIFWEPLWVAVWWDQSFGRPWPSRCQVDQKTDTTGAGIWLADW